MPAIKIIMKYSNVFPIFFFVGSVYFMIACEKAVARKSLTPDCESIWLSVVGTQNYTSNPDLKSPSSKNKYFYITPGPLPTVRLFPLQHDCTPTLMPLHAMNTDREKQFYKLNDKCLLIRCD